VEAARPFVGVRVTGVPVALPGEGGPLEFGFVQGADQLGVQPFDPRWPRVGLHLQGKGVSEGRVDDGGTGEERVVDRHQGNRDRRAVRLRFGGRRPRPEAVLAFG
jgi:hypothetical protein